MLGPYPIPTGMYPMATKPLLGFEQQLWVSTQPFTDLGLLTVTGVNSGTYTANTAPNTVLASAPQELLCILETTGLLGDSPLVVQVVGADKHGNPLSGVATFTPPGYAQDRNYDIHQHRAVDVIPYQNDVWVDGTPFMTISAVTPLGASAAYLNSQFRLAGFPPLASLIKIGTKISAEFDEKVQDPVAIQDGKDKGKYIKPGTIPVGTLTISSKDPVSADGLRRYNGLALTGVIEEVKQDVLHTQHVWLGNLFITAKPKGGEGEDPVTLECNALYQVVGAVVAQ